MDHPSRKEQTALLEGQSQSLAVTCDVDREKRSEAPFICCSATSGYVRITGFVRSHPSRDEILALANWMTDSSDGALVAVIPEIGNAPGLALIQANHGSQQGPGFYQAVHGDSHGIWRDFYFATVFAAVKESDALWEADEIRLAHPVNGAWDLDLMTVTLEAIGHLADRHTLHAKEIHLDCLHGVSNRMFEQALSTLNREQAEETEAPFREFEIEEQSFPAELGDNSLDARIWRIPLERA